LNPKIDLKEACLMLLNWSDTINRNLFMTLIREQISGFVIEKCGSLGVRNNLIMHNKGLQISLLLIALPLIAWLIVTFSMLHLGQQPGPKKNIPEC
jgi:hypothetical protein